MNEETFRDQVIERMNVLIRLLLDGSAPAENISTRSKIDRLVGLGLPPAAVAKVIGKPVNYVTAAMTQKPQSKKRKKNKDDGIRD